MGAGASGGAAETEARATTLAGAIGHAATANAPGVEAPAGGGEVRHTRGRKE